MSKFLKYCFVINIFSVILALARAYKEKIRDNNRKPNRKYFDLLFRDPVWVWV